MDNFPPMEMLTWRQSKIMKSAIQVNVGGLEEGQNINLFISRVVNLLLRNCGGRDRRPN